MTIATDTKQASRREVAERLLDHLDALLLRTVKLAAIEEVLSERDERAAKIVSDARFEGEHDLRSLAHRIRNGDTNAAR